MKEYIKPDVEMVYLIVEDVVTDDPVLDDVSSPF